MEFFMPPNENKEVEENQWKNFNKLSNPDNPEKFKKRVYSVKQLNIHLKLIYEDKVDDDFPDSTIPLCAIIETDNTFDLYGIKPIEENNKVILKHYLHQINKTKYVIAEYFD